MIGRPITYSIPLLLRKHHIKPLNLNLETSTYCMLCDDMETIFIHSYRLAPSTFLEAKLRKLSILINYGNR